MRSNKCSGKDQGARNQKSNHNNIQDEVNTSTDAPRYRSLLCRYKSGKCTNRRAIKRNGQLHTLCPFHRARQNEHQRKCDRKHRVERVSKKKRTSTKIVSSRKHTPRCESSKPTQQLEPDSECDCTSESSVKCSQTQMGKKRAGIEIKVKISCEDDHTYQEAVDAIMRFKADKSISSIAWSTSPSHNRSSEKFFAPVSTRATQIDSPVRTRLPPIRFLTQKAMGKFDSMFSVTSPVMDLSLPN